METTYFQNCLTEDACKAEFRTLFALHRQDAAMMQAINLDLKNSLDAIKAFNEVIPETTDKAKDILLKDAIEFAQSLPAPCKVEIIGSWVWVSGTSNTEAGKEVRQLLAEKKFKFSGKKQMWYFTTAPFRKRRGELPIEKIRAVYGRQEQQEQD